MKDVFSQSQQETILKEKFSSLLDSAKKIRSTHPEKALRIAENILTSPEIQTDTVLWVDALYISHYVYAQYGDYEKALAFTNRQEELASSLTDKSIIVRILENKAYDYNLLNFPKEALKYRDQAIKIAKEENIITRTVAIIHSNYGDYYRLKEKDYEKALAYNDTAIIISNELPGKSEYAFFLANRSELYIELEQYDNALKFALEAKSIMDTLPSGEFYPLDLAFTYQCLGLIYLGKKEPDSAFVALNQGLSLAKEVGGIQAATAIYKILADVEEFRQNEKGALTYFKLYKMHDDSIKAKQSKELAASMQFRFNEANNAQKITILDQDKKFAEVTLENQKKISYLLGALLTLILIFFIYFYRSYEIRKTHYRELRKQNNEIQSKNDEILAQKASIEGQNTLLEQKNLELDQLIQENNNLIGIVAHDLKAPLKQINGLVSIIKLEDDNLKDSQRECLGKISNSSKRASDLISKILNLEALEANKKQIDIQAHNLSEIVGTCRDLYENQANKKDIKIKLDGENLPLISLCDKSFCMQIIENILSNAIKFSPVGKNICISLSEQEQNVQCAIKDEGPGINQHDMTKLFGKFQKLSARPTGGETSNGLGLSIVKKYTEAMNGNVWCESEEGNGATFIVELPKAI